MINISFENLKARKAFIFQHFRFLIAVEISYSAELSMKKIYNLGARTGNGTLAKLLKEGFFYVHQNPN